MSKQYYLRGIVQSDIIKLYEWANDEQTRKNSINSNYVDFETHSKWFERVSNSPNITIFILTDGDEDFGYIRFETDNNDKATISYGIASNYRGNGLGKLIIHLGVSSFLQSCQKVTNIEAVVKKGNVASQIIFRKLGFAEEIISENELINYNILCKEYKTDSIEYEQLFGGGYFS